MVYLLVGIAILCGVFSYLGYIMVSDMGWKKALEGLCFAVGVTTVVAVASVLISRGVGSL